MKNLNPRSGLRQVITGGYNVARKDIFDLIKKKHLTFAEIGYYLLFFTVADWDKNKNRYGCIRHEIKDLSTYLELPYSTINDNLNRLVKKNVIEIYNSTPRIVNFDWVDRTIMNLKFKEKFDDEFLENYFENSSHKCENSQILGLKQSKSIRDSIKDEIKDNYQNKIVVIRQNPRTDEEYKKLFEENPNFPSLVDMKWIDENAVLKINITNKEQESDVVNLYFDGNVEKYVKCLISGGVYDTM
jgi:predicted transcriptional regulator